MSTASDFDGGAADPGNPAAPATARGFKGGFRQSMSWLHTWIGLVLSVVLYFMFITGAVGYFTLEIDRWMQPELPAPPKKTLSPEAKVAAGLAHLQAKLPQARTWWVALPDGDRSATLTVGGEPKPGPDGQEGKPFQAALDPSTGKPYREARETGGGAALYVMHYALHYLPWKVAMYIVGVATMFMLVAIVTGIVVHKKIFSEFFTFRPGKGQRSWLDAHNLVSVLALPFFVMITYSGLVFYTYEYMPSVKAAVYGVGEEASRQFSAEQGEPRDLDPEAAGKSAAVTPISPLLAQAAQRWGAAQLWYVYITNPGDVNARIIVYGLTRGFNPYYTGMWFDGVSGVLLYSRPPTAGADGVFTNVIVALHEGLFAGPLLRWLYFLSGLLGAAMIATGLVLWTSKRRQQLGKDGHPDLGLRFVERFNVGIIAGLPIGIAAYFWANRLIPVGLQARADWELHTLFIVWALALLHGALRPAQRAWLDQLGLAVALYALLPLLNALTTQIHLGRTLPAGDWVLAGFDLTCLALAAVFGWAWMKMRARLQRAGDALSQDRPAVAVR